MNSSEMGSARRTTIVAITELNAKVMTTLSGITVLLYDAINANCGGVMVNNMYVNPYGEQH